MERPSFQWSAGIFVAIIVASGLYFSVGNHLIAGISGLMLGTGFIMSFRIFYQHSTHTTGNVLSDRQWTGLSTGLIILAALVSGSPTLPIATDLRLGLGFLIITTGFVGYTAGIMAETERYSE